MEIKVVINRCYGGFSLSREAQAYMAKHAPELDGSAEYYNAPREHPVLIRCVEELGSERASGECAELKIVTLTVELDIKDFDGKEEARLTSYAD